MVSIYKVDPEKLIRKVAEELKKYAAIQPPEWAPYVKTGLHKERAPVDKNWWYIRVAAILRTVFVRGPIGVSKLRTKYGGKQNRGVRPEKFVKGSGNIIRKALQQLEIEALVAKSPNDKKKGRVIAPKGHSLLEKCAISIMPKQPKKAVKKVEAPKKEEKPKKEETEKTVPKKEAKTEVKKEKKKAEVSIEKTKKEEKKAPKKAEPKKAKKSEKKGK